MPAPWLGSQVRPSLSDQAIRLTLVGRSWETKVRPSAWSVNRIGSKVTWEVSRALRSCQFAVAGEVQSLKSTFRVSVPAMYITDPVRSLTPRVGSPALCPLPFGGV